MTTRSRRYARLSAALVLLSCGPHTDGPAASEEPIVGQECDALVPQQCGFPFPSDHFTRADSASPTGKRVAFGRTTLPVIAVLQRPIDPAGFADSDGFSPGQAPLTYLPGATATGLPTESTIDRSLGPDSPTVLLEAESLTRVPHFAEIDASFADDDRPTLMIRPVVRLKDATRYIVAIRRVVDSAGVAIAPSRAFTALRDAKPDARIEARRSGYDQIFAKLEAAGVPRSDLQIAWDYTTASRDNNTRALVHMRDDALATVGPDGPPYRILKVEENPNPHIRRRISVVMTVPRYLESETPGAKLLLGADGLPKQAGTMDVELVVHVPNRLAATGTAGPLVQNGHGLLGSMHEGENGYLAEFADGKGYVAFSVDFLGFAGDDTGLIANTVTGDLGAFRQVVARQQQGLINSLVAMRLMKGRFVADPNVTFMGNSVIDPAQRFYRGDSQGGIMGTTYMALSTEVTRGLLGEPGFPYNLLMPRSSDFGLFGLLVHTAYNSGADSQLALGLVQMLWDGVEPNGYAPYMTENTLPNTPPHTVLIHAAIGDHQVTTLGAHILARTVKAKSLRPQNRAIWGVPEESAPLTGSSAIVEYDFGLPPVPTTNTPPTQGDDPHDKVRVLPSAQDQSDRFFREGAIVQTCSGPCKE